QPLLHIFLALALAISASALGYAQPGKAASDGNCTHPDPASRPDCSGAIAFLAKFQDALKRHDRDAVASLVNYPLLVTAGGKTHIRSRAQFLANYQRVFTAPVRAAILKANADDVWGNSNGFMVGGGVIWFDAIIPRNEQPDVSAPDYWKKYPFKIITVNPPIR
ncbi:MAG TPA: hypothetical protein VGG59_09195, partial [Acidobacteriaceae bacterium]